MTDTKIQDLIELFRRNFPDYVASCSLQITHDDAHLLIAALSDLARIKGAALSVPEIEARAQALNVQNVRCAF